MTNDFLPEWLTRPIEAPDANAESEARAHQAQLTKPAGSLGRLEQLAVTFAGYQGRSKPALENIIVRVFAADHGIAARGTSAYPQEVTAQMVANFCHGGAAISVLAKQLDADFRAVNLGCVGPVAAHKNLVDYAIAPATADFSQAPAMTVTQLNKALDAGFLQAQPGDLFIGGEMGIGNTTSAAALLAALFQLAPEAITGKGTGIDDATLTRKTQLIATALGYHREHLTHPAAILQRLGGFEIAALVGAYVGSAQRGVPVLVDGFISTAAAAVAVALQPTLAPWLVYGHLSNEAGHKLALEQLGATPLLALDMRLGEGSGAALAAGVIQQALALHSQMATFADAGVSHAD
ncbi:nicotinate-nucleotide--dimethylbenzimidazole phosphoribosyltransferase [Gilvimarinus agarilyticus]|uniref:nicotinate-nucleotide--dimethylbenzimidazole phosphoribosyltransferase n=1 Tax=Gilvimarinus agarilyticus TaxID=679259 RepID=UPI0005A184D9|nr:nicotinate-nucleotide--dimethylbenzimidazole phosphoribosyltransferase [Gilvimarinus agarilyticus]